MRSPRRVVVSALVFALVSSAVFLIGWLNDSDSRPGEWKETLGFLAVYLTPSIVALIAVRRDTPLYVVAAGTAMVPLSLVSIVLIPALVIVAIMVSGVARYVPLRRGVEVEVAGFFVVVLGTLTAFGFMLGRTTGSILLGLIPLAIVLVMATVRAPRTPAPVGPEFPHRPPVDLPA